MVQPENQRRNLKKYMEINKMKTQQSKIFGMQQKWFQEGNI